MRTVRIVRLRPWRGQRAMEQGTTSQLPGRLPVTAPEPPLSTEREGPSVTVALLTKRRWRRIQHSQYDEEEPEYARALCNMLDLLEQESERATRQSHASTREAPSAHDGAESRVEPASFSAQFYPGCASKGRRAVALGDLHVDALLGILERYTVSRRLELARAPEGVSMDAAGAPLLGEWLLDAIERRALELTTKQIAQLCLLCSVVSPCVPAHVVLRIVYASRRSLRRLQCLQVLQSLPFALAAASGSDAAEPVAECVATALVRRAMTLDVATFLPAYHVPKLVAQTVALALPGPHTPVRVEATRWLRRVHLSKPATDQPPREEPVAVTMNLVEALCSGKTSSQHQGERASSMKSTSCTIDGADGLVTLEAVDQHLLRQALRLQSAVPKSFGRMMCSSPQRGKDAVRGEAGALCARYAAHSDPVDRLDEFRRLYGQLATMPLGSLASEVALAASVQRHTVPLARLAVNRLLSYFKVPEVDGLGGAARPYSVGDVRRAVAVLLQLLPSVDPADVVSMAMLTELSDVHAARDDGTVARFRAVDVLATCLARHVPSTAVRQILARLTAERALQLFTAPRFGLEVLRRTILQLRPGSLGAEEMALLETLVTQELSAFTPDSATGRCSATASQVSRRPARGGTAARDAPPPPRRAQHEQLLQSICEAANLRCATTQRLAVFVDGLPAPLEHATGGAPGSVLLVPSLVRFDAAGGAPRKALVDMFGARYDVIVAAEELQQHAAALSTLYTLHMLLRAVASEASLLEALCLREGLIWRICAKRRRLVELSEQLCDADGEEELAAWERTVADVTAARDTAPTTAIGPSLQALVEEYVMLMPADGPRVAAYRRLTATLVDYLCRDRVLTVMADVATLGATRELLGWAEFALERLGTPLPPADVASDDQLVVLDVRLRCLSDVLATHQARLDWAAPCPPRYADTFDVYAELLRLTRQCAARQGLDGACAVAAYALSGVSHTEMFAAACRGPAWRRALALLVDLSEPPLPTTQLPLAAYAAVMTVCVRQRVPVPECVRAHVRRHCL